MKYGNQRVEFKGDRVDKDVIADGKRFDELIFAFQRGEFTEQVLDECIKTLNIEACK